MTMFALWLAALGAADLVRWSPDAGRARTLAAGLVAAAVAVLGCVLGGLGAGRTASWALLLSALAALWLWSSSGALRSPGARLGVAGRWRVPAWLPFVTLAGGGLGLLAGAGRTPALEGGLLRWYDGLAVPSAAGLSFDRFAVVVGGLLFLQATANVVVRLVLASAGSPAEQGESTLKGGRVLGPMERSFIFALGVAGELTAASVIVAAKGLLRFPEIQSSARDTSRRVDELTEYFLVGSLTSWLLALVLLPLT